MRNFFLGLLLSGVASAAFADCPAPPDHSEQLETLIAAVKLAPDANAAQLITNEMWSLWADAPDDKAQQMLDDGLARRSGQDLDGAKTAFEQLIAYCPSYAEGYNQRAFILFIQKKYEPALVDLTRAIELSPNHIAAISGKALTYIGLKRDAEAQALLRDAVKMNPWLKERQFLTEDVPEPETDL